MNIDIKKLQKQFPLCEFTNSSIYRHQFYINFKSYNLYFTDIDYYFVLEDFKHVYDTIDYVMSFLYSCNCKIDYGIVKLCDHIKILINKKYIIQINEQVIHTNADELIEIIKKELNIVTSYKPVID